MAADRGLPATRLTMSGLAPSLTAAGPGRSTVSAQHHAAAARRLTGPSLCPCDEPSTQRRRTPADADTICRRKIWSTGLLIVRCHPKWTPLCVLQQPWKGDGTRMILLYIERPLTRQVRNFRGPPQLRPTHHRDETQLADEGPGEQQETDHPPGPLEWRTSLWLSLVRISSVEQQALLRSGHYRRRPRHWQDTHRRWMRKPRRHNYRPCRGVYHQWLSHNDRHARRLNHRTLRRSHAKSSVEVTNRGHHRRKGTNVPKHLFHIRQHEQGHRPMFISHRRTGQDQQFIFEINPWIDLRSHT